jgi:large subunit ribosomal protein L9
MRIILLERIEHLGGIGTEVNVKPGYARNFLLPRNKALVANDRNRARFEREKAEIVARNEQARAEAASLGEKVDGVTLVLLRQAGDTGQLYGSVSARDVAEAAREAGHAVDRQHVRLDTPIKTIGLHSVPVRLHPEVTVKVTVNVARSADEAERQAKGEDVVAAMRAEQDAIDAEMADDLAAANAEMADSRFDAD